MNMNWNEYYLRPVLVVGLSISPRLANAGGETFWRAYRTANYSTLDELARGCVELSKIGPNGMK